MSITVDFHPADRSQRLAEFIKALIPGGIKRDPFGLVSGYRAYAIYTQLSAMSEAELGELALERTSLPSVAMKAALASTR